MSKFEISKKIDQWLFTKCDDLKKQAFYQKITDANSAIDDEARPVISFVATLAFILVPIIIIFSMLIGNIVLKSEIESKENLYQQAQKYINLKNQTESQFGEYVSSPKINDKETFLSEIRSAAGMLSAQNINITKFNNKELSDSLTQVQATITFAGATTESLGLFIENLSLQKKIKFERSRIIKIPSKNQLEGEFEVVQLSK
ncbi:MAG: hypothetical protein H6621_08395 [Halobacteriovoraceae bacterium]|nr:hypothetical protein [Halobacteriovoraceae bacterium]